MANGPFIYTRTIAELGYDHPDGLLPESVILDGMKFYRQHGSPYKPRTAAVAVYATLSGAFVLELR